MEDVTYPAEVNYMLEHTMARRESNRHNYILLNIKVSHVQIIHELIQLEIFIFILLFYVC